MAIPVISGLTVDSAYPYNDGDEFYIICDIDNSPVYAFVYYVNEDEYFALELQSGVSYKATIDPIMLTEILLGNARVVAANADGIAYQDFQYGVFDRTSNLLVKESFEDDPSDWIDCNSIIHTWIKTAVNVFPFVRVNINLNLTSEDYYAKLVSTDTEAHIKMRMDFKINTSCEGNSFVGLFYMDDNDQMINRIGFDIQYDLITSKYDPVLWFEDITVVSYSEGFSVQLDPDVNYIITMDYQPENKLIVARLYEAAVPASLSLLETVWFELTTTPLFDFNNFGIHNAPPGSDVWSVDFFNMDLWVGEEVDSYPRIVSELEVNNSYTPTDVQILSHYYDFESGDDIVTDSSLTVEIFDSDNVLQDTLSGLIRDDGWYEAYWDTTGVTRDTYKVKVTAEINGKTAVMEEWVSIQ